MRPHFTFEKQVINNFLIEAAAKVTASCPYLQDFLKKIFFLVD